MNPNLLFQYCQKLIILSPNKKSVLLAKRKGETDFDEVFSFIGGKMETTDETIVGGMKREKNEEIGEDVKIKVLPDETTNVLFRKKDGNSMILPHIAGVFVSGDIVLNDEYSEYKWVPVAEIDSFEPKIANIPASLKWALSKLDRATEDQFVEI
jgi:ADP-ribose pyrophosphatase YjhB (NUDIX family)